MRKQVFKEIFWNNKITNIWIQIQKLLLIADVVMSWYGLHVNTGSSSTAWCHMLSHVTTILDKICWKIEIIPFHMSVFKYKYQRVN
jgi:uncharacterized membrane protein YcfT